MSIVLAIGRSFAITSLSLCAVVATAEAGQSSSARASESAIRVFEPAASTLAADPSRPGFSVTVQADAMNRAAAIGNVVEMPLANGLTVRSRVTWAQADGFQAALAGPLEGLDGETTLTMVGDTLVGRIVVNGRLFVVRRAPGSSVHVVTEIHPGDLPPEAAPLTPPASDAPPQPAADQRGLSDATDTNEFVDVMILYTRAARVAAGGTPAMLAEVTAAVNTANVALANSRVTHRFRLVYQQEVLYVEDGHVEHSLDQLTDKDDGFMDEVHLLRDQYRADVVTLFTTDADACGVGWLLSSPSPRPSCCVPSPISRGAKAKIPRRSIPSSPASPSSRWVESRRATTLRNPVTSRCVRGLPPPSPKRQGISPRKVSARAQRQRSSA